MALIELCAGISPEAFDADDRAFFAAARHRDRGVPFTLDHPYWANVFASDLPAR